jgi:hypothetical protein
LPGLICSYLSLCAIYMGKCSDRRRSRACTDNASERSDDCETTRVRLR